MRVKVTRNQLDLLLNNFYWISDRGLRLKMSSRTTKYLMDENKGSIKSYLVNFSLNGYRSKIKVYSTNITRARRIASELLPSAKIFNAYKVG